MRYSQDFRVTEKEMHAPDRSRHSCRQILRKVDTPYRYRGSLGTCRRTCTESVHHSARADSRIQSPPRSRISEYSRRSHFRRTIGTHIELILEPCNIRWEQNAFVRIEKTNRGLRRRSVIQAIEQTVDESIKQVRR